VRVLYFLLSSMFNNFYLLTALEKEQAHHKITHAANKMLGQYDVDIYYAILNIVAGAGEDDAHLDKAIPEQVALLAHLSYCLFEKYVKQLVALAMVSLSDKRLRITDKGLDFLFEIKHRNSFLSELGLEI
jgi:predicted transcriptional regulator